MIDFRALFEEHGPRLVEIAASIVGGRAEAEDVVQEAFVKAFRSRERFRGEASPATWLRRIVVNEAVEASRRHRRARPAPATEPDELPSPAPEPLARASALERSEAVRCAVDALPEDQRTAIVLREIEGLSYREIAEALGLPLGTVESRVIRGRERLRALLKEHIERSEG